MSTSVPVAGYSSVLRLVTFCFNRFVPIVMVNKGTYAFTEGMDALFACQGKVKSHKKKAEKASNSCFGNLEALDKKLVSNLGLFEP